MKRLHAHAQSVSRGMPWRERLPCMDLSAAALLCPSPPPAAANVPPPWLRPAAIAACRMS
ncbi:exported hypothetical protein [Xanthomonas citri pv. fuscans]|nr:exported hypothetical protein [Xanthomonas citri pv. fuscans]SOO20811.1 exported hypothetical protein [Xanthomonas citri pv. fuscans]SOO44305.1 exported hypothetical protein [Xanthomonas citri pv. fuscans]